MRLSSNWWVAVFATGLTGCHTMVDCFQRFEAYKMHTLCGHGAATPAYTQPVVYTVPQPVQVVQAAPTCAPICAPIQCGCETACDPCATVGGSYVGGTVINDGVTTPNMGTPATGGIRLEPSPAPIGTR